MAFKHLCCVNYDDPRNLTLNGVSYIQYSQIGIISGSVFCFNGISMLGGPPPCKSDYKE